MLKVTILGCGGSLGVPRIGCDCSVCCSDSIYNKRTRSAIFIESTRAKILVDFGYDIKNQLIKENVREIDAAILSHDHADHVSGIDDLRIFSFIQKEALSIYTENATATRIRQRYAYLFESRQLISKPLSFYDKFNIKDLEVQLFKQNHGSIDSLGIKINNFVYSCDVADFPIESRNYLHNLDVWIVDCRDYSSNSRHAGLDKVLEWNEEFKPKKIYLTNLAHGLDYHELLNSLPRHIKPLYDGFKFIT